MKKILFIIFALFAFSVRADNVITSKEYVDTAAGTLQEQLPAKNTDVVLTYTDTAGTVGEKAIYDSSTAYSGQNDALVTAGAFNTAVQNALDTEFVCIDWLGDVHDNAHCLLYQIRSNIVHTQTLPAGYTQLEYLASTGTQYVDTNTYLNASSKMEFKFMTDAVHNYAVFGASNGSYYQDGEISLFYNTFSTNNTSHVIEAVAPLSNTSSRVIFPRPVLLSDTAYTISYDKNNLVVNGVAQASDWYSEYMGQKTAYLFATNRGTKSWIGGNTKIYWFKIYNNENLVRNFIPARRNSDGKLGMYDTVSNSFFTNSGTGEFVAGPVVYF